MPWPQDAYVGQKVICIDDSKPRYGSWGDWPKRGEIYTIARIGIVQGKIAIDTIELNDLAFNLPNPNWLISRFRPVQSTARGMEILRRLQNPQNHCHLEDA